MLSMLKMLLNSFVVMSVGLLTAATTVGLLSIDCFVLAALVFAFGGLITTNLYLDLFDESN